MHLTMYHMLSAHSACCCCPAAKTRSQWRPCWQRLATGLPRATTAGACVAHTWRCGVKSCSCMSCGGRCAGLCIRHAVVSGRWMLPDTGRPSFSCCTPVVHPQTHCSHTCLYMP
jgi:hypothetical protein